MRAHSLRLLADVLILGLICFVALLPVQAAAQDVNPPRLEYQLDVSINGQPTNLVARFADLGEGHFASPASELRQLGFSIAETTPDDELVALDGLPGLAYIYDEANQSISLIAADDLRVRKTYDARGEAPQSKVTPAGYGAVLNYDIFAAAGGDNSFSGYSSQDFTGVNATLDARAITPQGILSQTAILGTTLADETNALRLETTYTFSNEDNLTTWRAGDFISGSSVGWSRPVRLGGVQAQRTFSMRPDLVTNPLPAISGSAAVPSTVDVFVNGIKSHTQEVGAGPYQIDNLPTITGSGVAHVVTRDAAGRESVQSLSFYTSPRLLKSGLYDFSVEAGLPRGSYGIESFQYDDTPAATATLRSGITDWLTAEAHGEVSESLYNAGAGFVANTFDNAIVSGAVSASSSDRGTGFQLYGSVETKIGPVRLNARSQRAFDGYDDLASLTARTERSRAGSSPIIVPGLGRSLFSLAPPIAVDSVTLSLPIAFDKSSISATLLRYEPVDGDVSEIATASYSRPLIENASMYATGFVDLNDDKNTGFYLGVNMPLEDRVSTSAGVRSNKGKVGVSVDANRSVGPEAGSWGWRVRDYEGDHTLRSAAVSHRMSAARLEATVNQDDNGVRGTAEVEGAVAMLGGDMYASNRIDDSFAVVDAHAAGVRVLRENVQIGKTNEDGKILIPNLSAYNRNKVSIDPMDLPLNAEIATTYDYVTPSFKSGVYVEFDVKKATPSGLVILQDASGTLLPAGAEGYVEGSDEPFIVGYDGRAFIKDLKPVNSIRVKIGEHECRAQFSFADTGEVQPVFGPEVCQ